MENKTGTTKSKGFLAEWLEKIQQDSWQLELLISGLALYGVYSGIELIEDFKTFAELNGNTGYLQMFFAFAHGVLFVGWRIFFFNLLIHVILRGLWIASIGLRYVSDDIDFDELNYAPKYTSYLKKQIGTYDEFIEKLEKLCSVIFAFTFLVFLLFISLTIFTLILIVPFVYKSSYSGIAIIIPALVLLYLALGLIVAIDFITLGSIRKIREPWVVKIYSPIFKFYSYVTLSFLYRPILYNFLDQKYTRRLFIAAVPYVIILGSIDFSFSNYINPYKDEAENLIKEGLIIEDGRYVDLLEKSIDNKSDYEKKKYFNNNLKGILLSNYHVKDGKLSFFIRELEFSSFLSRIKSKEPIFKEGVLFNLFMEHKNENQKIKDIERIYLEKYVLMYKEYSVNRNSLVLEDDKINIDSLLKPQKDSITKIIDSLEVRKKSEIDTFKENYNKDIFEKLVDNVQVKIDSIDYTDSLSCKYYRDQFVGAEGVLCNLFESSLPKGNKIIEITTKSFPNLGPDSIRLNKIKVPVYIE